MSRTYVILPFNDVTDEMIENALEISRGDLRKSLNGSNTVLKYEGSTPSCFSSHTKYTHEEILTIMGSSDWLDPNEEM